MFSSTESRAELYPHKDMSTRIIAPTKSLSSSITIIEGPIPQGGIPHCKENSCFPPKS